MIVSDDGPGFPDDVIDRIGDPFVSRRREDAEAGGLGLGIFIAKTLLERTGAVVTFGRGRGATVTIEWTRAALEALHLRRGEVPVRVN